MKKIICLLLVALLCVGLAACSSKPNNENPASNAVASSSQSDDATEAPAVSSQSSGKPYASVEDYLNTPEVQSEVNSAIEANDSGLNLEVYADGDTLVYDYTFTETFDDDTLDVVKDSLDTALEEKASSFESVVTVLKSNVDVENPKVKVVYRNSDGTVITEKTYE